MTIDDYLDRALLARGFTSDRELSAALGLTGIAVSTYRTKRCWPREETMITIAEFAGIDARRAVMDLNTWRAKSTRVRDLYAKIAASLAAVVAAVLIGGITSAHAGTAGEQFAVRAPLSIHYAII